MYCGYSHSIIGELLHHGWVSFNLLVQTPLAMGDRGPLLAIDLLTAIDHRLDIW